VRTGTVFEAQNGVVEVASTQNTLLEAPVFFCQRPSGWASRFRGILEAAHLTCLAKRRLRNRHKVCVGRICREGHDRVTDAGGGGGGGGGGSATTCGAAAGRVGRGRGKATCALCRNHLSSRHLAIVRRAEPRRGRWETRISGAQGLISLDQIGGGPAGPDQAVRVFADSRAGTTATKTAPFHMRGL